MAQGLQKAQINSSPFVATEEIEKWKASMRRRKKVRSLVFRLLAMILATWILLMASEVVRHLVPPAVWSQFIETPVQAGISKIK